MNLRQRTTLLEQLAADGFVTLDERCDDSLVQSLLSVSLHQADIVRKALGTRDIGIGSAAGYIEIVQRSPGRWDVPISPQQFGIDEKAMPWWPLITAVLGAGAEHSFSGVVFSEPGSTSQHWHTDSPHEAPEHRPPHAINVLVALQAVPMQMGPTEFARGSHLLTNHLRNPGLVLDQLIYQHAGTSPATLVGGTEHAVPESCISEMIAGSCIVFDDRLMHRGLANASDQVRRLVYFSYRRKGYAVNTHFESQRSVFDSTS